MSSPSQAQDVKNTPQTTAASSGPPAPALNSVDRPRALDRVKSDSSSSPPKNTRAESDDRLSVSTKTPETETRQARDLVQAMEQNLVPWVNGAALPEVRIEIEEVKNELDEIKPTTRPELRKELENLRQQIEDILKRLDVPGPRPGEDPKPIDDTDPPRPDTPGSKLEDARGNFIRAMEASGKLSGQQLERLKQMSQAFEGRMASLVAMRLAHEQRKSGGPVSAETRDKIIAEVQQTMQDTYGHLTELVTTARGNGELFDQGARAKLAENYMFHLADPRSVDQGSNGTCWNHAAVISFGLMDHPDDMARFLKEVSLTGTFMARNNGEVGQPERLIRFPPSRFYAKNEERNWTIDGASRNGWRSPVSMIFDQGLTYMVGKMQPDGGNYQGQHGSKRIMTMVTGEVPPPPRGHLNGYYAGPYLGNDDFMTLSRYGGYQIYSPGHLQSIHMILDGKFEWSGNSILHNGQALKLDGTDALTGYIVRDNQWGERVDSITHRVENLAQARVTDIQDQKYTPYDPLKVDNDQTVDIRPGNDSSSGATGGGQLPPLDGPDTLWDILDQIRDGDTVVNDEVTQVIKELLHKVRRGEITAEVAESLIRKLMSQEIDPKLVRAMLREGMARST